MCALVCIILSREFGCGKEFGRNILPPVEPLEGNPQNLRGDPLEKKSAAHFAHTSTTTLQVQVHQRAKAMANCLGLEEEGVVEVVFGCNFWVVCGGIRVELKFVCRGGGVAHRGWADPQKGGPPSECNTHHLRSKFDRILLGLRWNLVVGGGVVPRGRSQLPRRRPASRDPRPRLLRTK